MNDLTTLSPEVSTIVVRANSKGTALSPEQAEDYVLACGELGVSRHTQKRWLSYLKEYDADTLTTAIMVKAQAQYETDGGYLSLPMLLEAMTLTNFPTDGYAADCDYAALFNQITEYEFNSIRGSKRDEWGELKGKPVRGYKVKQSWLDDVSLPSYDEYY